MPTNRKLNDHLIAKAVKLGAFKIKQQAVNTALAEFIQRRQRLAQAIKRNAIQSNLLRAS